MNTLNEDLNKEFDRIKKILDGGGTLNPDDLKIILLAQLAEEDQYERQN